MSTICSQGTNKREKYTHVRGREYDLTQIQIHFFFLLSGEREGGERKAGGYLGGGALGPIFYKFGGLEGK